MADGILWTTIIIRTMLWTLHIYVHFLRIYIDHILRHEKGALCHAHKHLNDNKFFTLLFLWEENI
jgi:hypothetical protein